MALLVLVMQLKGRISSPDVFSRARKEMTAVASCITGPGGAGLLPAAAFESEVTFTAETSFEESGAIKLGAGKDELRFRSIGAGTLIPSGDPDLKYGWVTWRVEGGFGEFDGANGVITSNFVIRGSGEITDSQLGTIFVK